MEEKENGEAPKKDGWQTIGTELKYYDTLKISQTSRGWIVLFFSIFVLPMTLCFGLAGVPWSMVLLVIVVYSPVLYFVQKKKRWALQALLFLFNITMLLLVIAIPKLLFDGRVLTIYVSINIFIIQAVIVEKEHYKIISDPSYRSQYLENPNHIFGQIKRVIVRAIPKKNYIPTKTEGVGVQKETFSFKNFLFGVVLLGVFMFGFLKQKPDYFDSLINLYTSNPSVIWILFSIVLFGWVIYIKIKPQDGYKSMFFAVATLMVLITFVPQSYEKKQEEIDSRNVYEEEMQKIRTDFEKSVGIIPWYTEDVNLWVEDLDKGNGYRMFVPPEMSLVPSDSAPEIDDVSSNKAEITLSRTVKKKVPENYESASVFEEYLRTSSTTSTTVGSFVDFDNTISLSKYTRNSTSSFVVFYAFDHKNDTYHEITIWEPYYSRDKDLFEKILRTFEPLY